MSLTLWKVFLCEFKREREVREVRSGSKKEKGGSFSATVCSAERKPSKRHASLFVDCLSLSLFSHLPTYVSLNDLSVFLCRLDTAIRAASWCRVSVTEGQGCELRGQRGSDGSR
jgi:hypothetical protein